MIHLIQHVIDQTAVSTPNKPVFKFDETVVTYAQMIQRTNQLAHFLRAHGVHKGDRVGIYLHKSLESVIALFGILKAGAAYVPLDPSLPAERLSFVIQDCGIRHLITEPRRWPTVAQMSQTAVDQLTCLIGVDVDGWPTFSWTNVYQSPANTLIVPGLMEDDLAYIMYTSGSTGTPKGMMHTHRSGLAFAKMMAELYGLRAADILSNHAPLHFDISTFDLFAGPLSGATTVIIPEEYKMLPASLTELIQDEQITVWYSVTTALVEMQLRGALEMRDLSSLRWVIFAGEPFPPKHLHGLMTQLPHARFSNAYGPAEVNVCTYFHIPPLPNEYAEQYVPIGRPWEIADWLIFDSNDQPVAEGEVGELLICAPTRMQGYWNRPELTEKGFYVQRPFPGSPFEKIFYRTGDLVQVDDHGQLRFLGRKDRQVKVRGFRIELDEVEVAISAHPAVAEVAVYPLPDGDGQRLEAAVVLIAGETAVSPERLAQHTATKLPSYAVPQTFVILPQFPRTGSGKINRRALQTLAQQTINA